VGWPEGVTVDAGDHTEASLEYGILSASMPITSVIPEKPVLGKRASTSEEGASEEVAASSPPKKKQKVAPTTNKEVAKKKEVVKRPIPAKIPPQTAPTKPKAAAETEKDKEAPKKGKQKKTFISVRP
jgi:hypothetical protein